MQPTLEALKSGASVLLNTAMAFGAGVTSLHRGPSSGLVWRAPATRQRRLGPYVILNKLAAGAMGQVYRARHEPTGEVCAVKVLARRASETQRRQFEQEIETGQRLRHPHLVCARDHGETPDGTLYFSMDLVDGIDLDVLVERDGPLETRRALTILRQVAALLAAVHEQGFVHRDIKPSNVMLCRGPDGEDNGRLLDFGLARRTDRGPRPAADRVVGTPLYISPEAISAPDTVDGRSDLYGLGAVAYYLLTGAPPFGGASVAEVCARHLLASPEPLRTVTRGAVSPELERVVSVCLAKEPAARPASARELIRRLERCPELDAVGRRGAA